MKSHCNRSFRMRAVGHWMRAVAPLIALSMLMGTAQRAGAYPVTFEFAGEVTSLHDPNNIFGGAVSVGDAFSGSYTFESTTPDSEDDPRFGDYQDAITDIAGEISGIDFFGPVDTTPDQPANDIVVSEGFGELRDVFSVLSGVQFFDHSLRFELNFILGSPDILQDDSLLLEPPPFDVFDGAGLRLISEIPGANVFLSGNLFALVPEPTTIGLLTIGAITLLRRPRRS